MRCLIKIPHQHLIYSFLFVAFLSFLSVFGFASDSYATSGTCTLSPSSYNSYSFSIPLRNSSCPNYSDYYYRLDSFSLVFATASSTPLDTFISFQLGSGSPKYNYNFTIDSLPFSLDVSSVPNFPLNTSSYFSNTSLPSVENLYLYFNVSLQSSNMRLSSLTLNFSYSDNLSDFVTTCPEVTPCPPIPENPYDDKLDEIKKAIYCASAVMIMIYFFFIVYKIIVKDGGRR